MASQNAEAICAALALCVAGFGGAFSLLWRGWRLRDLPISKLRSAAQGYIALEGLAWMMPGPEIRSPLSGERCVWWHCTVIRDKELIFSDTSDDLFQLADTTGECVIDPFKAHVIPSLSRTWFGHHEQPRSIPASTWEVLLSLGGDYRYHERLLGVGQPIYACGWFRCEMGTADYNEKSEVSDLLAEWKQNPRDLLRRFDTDRSGVIDGEEWDVARAKALEAVRGQYVEHASGPEIKVLAAPADGRRLLISSVDRLKLSVQERLLAGLCLAAGFASVLWLTELLKLHRGH